MYYTYILYSPSADQFYTGYTSVPVEKRLERHNNGWTQSTKSGIPWTLKYYKSFEEKSEAIKWENFIKRRKQINDINFIESLSSWIGSYITLSSISLRQKEY